MPKALTNWFQENNNEDFYIKQSFGSKICFECGNKKIRYYSVFKKRKIYDKSLCESCIYIWIYSMEE